MSSRRNFLKMFGCGVAASIFVPTTIIESPWKKRIIEPELPANLYFQEPIKESLKFEGIGRKLLGQFTNSEKDLIMTDARYDAQGRLELAQAMVEPIKVAFNYQAIGRKLLQVDELPQGVIPRYQKDVFSAFNVLGIDESRRNFLKMNFSKAA